MQYSVVNLTSISVFEVFDNSNFCVNCVHFVSYCHLRSWSRTLRSWSWSWHWWSWSWHCRSCKLSCIIVVVAIVITLRVSCSAVYCNRSCLFVAGWVCYLDNSKLRASWVQLSCCIVCERCSTDSPGLYDPCEREPTDLCSQLSMQEREDLTASAQVLLLSILFSQYGATGRASGL